MTQQVISLLDAPQQQHLELQDGPPTHPSALPSSSRNPEFTGERFFLERPADYQRIAALIAEGATISAVARQLDCCRNLIAAVVRREHASKTVEQLQAQTARRYRFIAELAQDRAVSELTEHDGCDTRAVKDLVAAAAVATDKGELLSGKPTARIAGSTELPSVQDAAAMLDLLRIGYEAGKESGQKKTGAAGGSPGEFEGDLACDRALVVDAQDVTGTE